MTRPPTLPTLPSDGPAPHDPQAEREAVDFFSRVNGPGELLAAILALLLTPGSQRERRAWIAQCGDLSNARALFEHARALGPSTRLPWFDNLIARAAKAPLAERQTLVNAARRLMLADGKIRPIDRLHWLALRHTLGEAPAENAASSTTSSNIADLSLHTRQQIARLTAYLSRMVPASTPIASETWYLAVMSPWLPAPSLPNCEPPDADGLVHALAEVQTMPWMLRPVLVRAWLEAARHHNPQIHPTSADALRLMCTLLTCPLPPELTRMYREK